MRGSEEQFSQILESLAANNKQYDTGAVKHYSWVQQSDNIFKAYSWSKEEFYKELSVRLGHKQNKTIYKKKKN